MATGGLTDIPEDAQHLRESADTYISKTRVQPCYNIHVTFSKALLLCSACNDQDVSKILQTPF